MKSLSERNVRAMGTIRDNRTNQASLPAKKEMKKKEGLL